MLTSFFHGQETGDANADPDIPEWQQKMRRAKQMLDDEDRAIAEGRIKASEASSIASMSKPETRPDGRQIVRISPDLLYE